MRVTICLFTLLLWIGCAPPPADDPRLDSVVDRLEVQDTINELFLATDSKDWDRVRKVFADDVLFDMTSLVGGEPEVTTPQAIVEAWSEGLGPVQAVHHQTGNFVVEVDGDAATASCYGTATHFRPDQEKKITYFVGSYDFHLSRADAGWKIDRIRFTAKYVD